MIGIEPEAWKKILEAKHVVHFVGSYPEYWQKRVAGKYFKILRTQQIAYDRAYILHPGSTDPTTYLYSLDFAGDDATAQELGLYPDDDASLYEILVGMKSSSGSTLAYPRYPMNEWFETLEEGRFIPNQTSDNFRYLSPFNEEISPADRPQVRFHTIKEEESVGVLLYNDAPEDNKVVLNFLVNRCLMSEVSEAELTEKELERARELHHPGIMARGKWAETVP